MCSLILNNWLSVPKSCPTLSTKRACETIIAGSPYQGALVPLYSLTILPAYIWLIGCIDEKFLHKGYELSPSVKVGEAKTQNNNTVWQHVGMFYYTINSMS